MKKGKGKKPTGEKEPEPDTQGEEQDPAELENLPDKQGDPNGNADDQDNEPDILTEFDSYFQAEDRITLYKYNRQSGEREYCQDFNIVPSLSTIAEKHGGGRFEIVLRAPTGQIKKKRRFTISDIWGAGQQHGQNNTETDRRAARLEIFQEMEMLERLIARRNPTQPGNYMEQMTQAAGASISLLTKSMDAAHTLQQKALDAAMSAGQEPPADIASAIIPMLPTILEKLTSYLDSRHRAATIRTPPAPRAPQLIPTGGNHKNMDAIFQAMRNNDRDFSKLVPIMDAAQPGLSDKIRASTTADDDQFLNFVQLTTSEKIDRDYGRAFLNYIRTGQK